MDNLIIKQDQDTPSVIFDVTKRKFLIEGRSLPEDAVEFYQPIMNFVVQFFASGAYADVVFEMKLNYFNTATSKQLLIIVLEFIKFNASIHWYYSDEDEDLLETGEDFVDVIKDNAIKNRLCFDESKFVFIPIFD